MKLTRRMLRRPEVVSLVLHQAEARRTQTVPCSIDRCDGDSPQCVALGFSVRLGDGSRCCTRNTDFDCEHRRREWRPSPSLQLDLVPIAFESTGFLELATASLHNLIEEIAMEEEGCHGETARAWKTGDWSHVDATRPKRRTTNQWRTTAQEAMYARLSVDVVHRLARLQRKREAS